MVEGAAVSASLLCLLHCIALPLLLLLLPGMLGLFAQSEAFHFAALALVIPSALAAFALGYRRHRKLLPPLLGVIGVASLVAALLPGQAEGAETLITVMGSALLVAGHALNWRLRAQAARSPAH
ncbi:MerC family mercury resistance protein [Altererythrobacter xixiisoli]|uniref:MerC family mercury resistance protein n=1 Tax=Croceibacterium xixiisoli TaxID=1476466 RepID=A0A6I4TRI1_9SPHN|nr:MerC domain-containing protein [Croceibacterium xixiisoli]MXO97741.1 MerC family mercury resistance protein [Croceibacterium xixiisoli]